jgi:arsenate reductase
MKITIYQKTTCTTCKQVFSLLKESGVDFTAVNYYTTPLSEKKLRTLLKKLKLSPRALLRSKEPMYKKLHLDEEHFSDDELIQLMTAHPDLLQRPIIEIGATAILARPPERLKEIFFRDHTLLLRL